jgi:hypothetical protein
MVTSIFLLLVLPKSWFFNSFGALFDKSNISIGQTQWFNYGTGFPIILWYLVLWAIGIFLLLNIYSQTKSEALKKITFFTFMGIIIYNVLLAPIHIAWTSTMLNKEIVFFFFMIISLVLFSKENKNLTLQLSLVMLLFWMPLTYGIDTSQVNTLTNDVLQPFEYFEDMNLTILSNSYGIDDELKGNKLIINNEPINLYNQQLATESRYPKDIQQKDMDNGLMAHWYKKQAVLKERVSSLTGDIDMIILNPMIDAQHIYYYGVGDNVQTLKERWCYQEVVDMRHPKYYDIHKTTLFFRDPRLCLNFHVYLKEYYSNPETNLCRLPEEIREIYIPDLVGTFSDGLNVNISCENKRSIPYWMFHSKVVQI